MPRRSFDATGREPPSFFLFLGLPLDGRRVPPLVHGLHGGGGAGAPPRLDLPLYSLLFRVPRSGPSQFLKFPEILNFDGLKFGHDFYPDIGFLAAKEGHQPRYVVATRVRGAPPCLVPPSGTVSRRFFFPKIIYIPKKSPSVFIPFGLCLIWIFRETKNATNRNWHWALVQYVHPKIV